MKHQALFYVKDKSEKLKVSFVAILVWRFQGKNTETHVCRNKYVKLSNTLSTFMLCLYKTHLLIQQITITLVTTI